MTPQETIPEPSMMADTATDGDGFELGRMLDALRRRWWLVVIVAALCTIGFGVRTARMPKQFRAEASLVIDASTPRVLTGVEEISPAGNGGWLSESFLETEFEIMRSRSVARAAGERMGLARNPQFTGLDAITDAAERARKEAEIDVADFVEGRYSVEADAKSNVVRIGVVDTNPQHAADLANAVAESYIEQNIQKRVSSTRDAGAWLTTQHATLKRKLETSEDELYRFMGDNDVLNASLDSQLEEVKQRLESFNTALADVQADRIRAQLDVQTLEELRSHPDLIDTLPEIQSADVVTSLKQKLIDLRAMRLDLQGRYQAAHPKMKILDEQETALSQALTKEVDAVLGALQRKARTQQNTEAGLKLALTAEREREARLNRMTLDYVRRKREVDTNNALYQMVTQRMKEPDIAGALPFNNVRMLDAARPPEAPFLPNVRWAVIMGLLLGLALGVGLVVGLELLNRTVVTPEDVERLGALHLGLLPVFRSATGATADRRPTGNRAKDLVAIKQRTLFVLDEPKSTAAECIRFLRTNLMFMSPDQPLRVIAVTSPAPSDGKTTVAVSMAGIMAQTGQRTLIVDADMRRPRLHRTFDVGSEVGLSSLVLNSAKMDEAVQRTAYENLDVLPCGPIPPNPAELVLTARFRDVIEQLSKRYDFVVIDTPPVGPVADPVMIGSMVDGIVVVAKSDGTPKVALRQAIRTLRDARVRVLGVVLNDVDLDAKRYGSSYTAYYRRYADYSADDGNG
jgi:polysaccharide biosynthesis transport protein